MCGICGFYSKRKETMENLIQMNNTLIHRGPDDHGEEICEIHNGYSVGLAHRRLAIVDLSLLAHQPMHSPDQSISIVFNGEIYNYKDLKRELRAEYSFKSQSDTEVLIASYLKWGKSFVNHLNGMFAIALLDREKEVLLLVRDRIGKKPLYYHIEDGNLCFASELKALMQNTYFNKALNTEIIGKFLNKQYIASPDSIYLNTYKLKPGMMLEIQKGEINTYKYWDIADEYHKADTIDDFEECKQELNKRLRAAVACRLVADVPIGAFLSGGYDSSIICAIAQELSEVPVKTFCIGFYEDKINEAPYARKIADFLGTRHTEYYISDDEMLRLVEDIPRYYDEPFADGSQVATMLVSKLAREHVTAVLSGDGGDEFFSGYNRYTTLQRAQKLEGLGVMLHYLRKIPGIEKKYRESVVPLKYRIISDDLNKNARTQVGINSYLRVIRGMLLQEPGDLYFSSELKYKEPRWDVRRMLLDQETYLPDDNLCKVDRASMRYSLECRCPLLDVSVMEFTYQIPQRFKNENGNQKKILKSLAYDYIPQELLDRPKQGFGVPLNCWMRGALKERLESYVERGFLKKQGIFNVENTQKLVINYLQNGDAGKDSGSNFSKLVWPFFIFQQWYEAYMC